MSFIGSYPHLVSALILLSLAGLAVLFLPAHRKMFTVSGGLAMPMAVYAYQHTPWYWNPKRTCSFVPAPEDLLFMTSWGVLVWFLATSPLRGRVRNELRWQRILLPYLILFILCLPVTEFFNGQVFGHLNVMYAHLLLLTLLGGACLWLRPAVWVLAVSGGGLSGLCYLPFLFVYMFCFPNYLESWNPKAQLQWDVFGLPAFELLWAVVFGASWSLFIAWVCNVRVDPVGPSAIRPSVPVADGKTELVPLEPAITLPRDLFAREDVDLEWWYYFGHLWSEDRLFGFHLVFFRTDRAGRRWWVPTSLLRPLGYYGHFALTDVTAGQFRYAHRRASPSTAGAARDHLELWLDDWSVLEVDGRHTLNAALGDASLSLSMAPAKPLTVHGENGLLYRRGQQTRSRLYFPRLTATGRLVLGGTEHEVTGLTWMDREFGSWILGNPMGGWDWVAVQLTDGREVDAYIMRDQEQHIMRDSILTWIEGDGSTFHLGVDEFRWQSLSTWKSPVTGASYPSGWQLKVPRLGLELEIVPALNCQELDTPGTTMLNYWEGLATVHGQSAGRPISGHAHVELVGYPWAQQGPSFAGWIAAEFLYQLRGNERVIGASAGREGDRRDTATQTAIPGDPLTESTLPYQDSKLVGG